MKINNFDKFFFFSISIGIDLNNNIIISVNKILKVPEIFLSRFRNSEVFWKS